MTIEIKARIIIERGKVYIQPDLPVQYGNSFYKELGKLSPEVAELLEVLISSYRRHHENNAINLLEVEQQLKPLT